MKRKKNPLKIALLAADRMKNFIWHNFTTIHYYPHNNPTAHYCYTTTEMTRPEDQVEYMLSNSIEASSKSPFHLIYCKVTFWPKCWIVVDQNDFQVLCDTPGTLSDQKFITCTCRCCAGACRSRPRQGGLETTRAHSLRPRQGLLLDHARAYYALLLPLLPVWLCVWNEGPYQSRGGEKWLNVFEYIEICSGMQGNTNRID